MALGKYKEMAITYRVEDLAGALIPGSRLSNILKYLEKNDKPISNMTQAFLRNNGLLALLSYAKKEIAYPEFLRVAESEQSQRRLAAEANAIEKRTAWNLIYEERKFKTYGQKKELARLRQTTQPWETRSFVFNTLNPIKNAKQAKPREKINPAKVKQAKLRQKYNLSHFIENRIFHKLMDILSRVDNRQRLSKDEVVWLWTKAEEYYTEELRQMFHKNEADFYRGEFKKNKDPWSAVNASSHYRKCNEAETADSMLRTIDLSVIKNKKLKSALCTTHGGVKRDLMKYDEALGFGEQAHLLTPKDFRPCTLLGAVNIEIGNHYLGHSWFGKAVERGYSEKSVDRELRKIFIASEKPKQDALSDYLLNMDPVRYSWAKKIHNKSRNK